MLQTATPGGKGGNDILLTSEHVIEITSKLHQAVLEMTQNKLNLQITDQYVLQIMYFVYMSPTHP